MRLGSDLAGQARELVAHRLGLRVAEDRHAEMDRTLREAAGASGRPALEAWLAGLASRPLADPAWVRLIARLTIGETHFWRDHACFEALERHVLPDLIAARHSGRALRVWSAACSTGEEPYSLAILLDRLLLDRAAWDLTVLATDLNPASLETARRGLYRPWSLRDVPAAVRERYFRERGARGIEVDSEIRRMVRFETANLTDGFPPAVTGGAMDLILCRNVIMYLTPEAARRAVAHLRGALAVDGWLVVAPAEASAE
ncbi:MAG TPA: CheR family methyltransferase, partial [Vicinamibacteria bacterium]|nr:CheR family methyltransferase [Vicinamibacteria bacterium]